jgi:hypothetical protein
MVNTRNISKINDIKGLINLNSKSEPIQSEMVTRRFTDPIPSFPGKAPTAVEMDVINKMVQFFQKKE